MLDIDQIKEELMPLVNRLYLFKDQIDNKPTNMFGDYISDQEDFVDNLEKIKILIGLL